MSWHGLSALTVMTGLVMLGCEDPTRPDLDARLEGDWTWVEATGGIAGLTLSPSSTGDMRSLRLDGSFAEFALNGTVERRVGYVVVEMEGGGGFQIVYDGPPSPFGSQTLELQADTLILVDPCCDGFTWRYARAR